MTNQFVSKNYLYKDSDRLNESKENRGRSSRSGGDKKRVEENK